MKREFLEELGIEKDVIDKIMAENGKDINNAKADLESKETELASVKEQLKTANEEIEGFKDLDVEGIKAKADEYKAKFEEAEAKAKEDLEKVQFEHKLETALRGAKAKNAKAVRALLDLEGLKLNEGEIVGLSEQLEAVKKENDYLFDTEGAQNSTPSFSRPTGNTGNTPITKEGIMDIKDPIERKKMIADNIELFE